MAPLDLGGFLWLVLKTPRKVRLTVEALVDVERWGVPLRVSDRTHTFSFGLGASANEKFGVLLRPPFSGCPRPNMGTRCLVSQAVGSV